MPKITLIGAGSVVFTRNLCSDILLTPVLQESTIALMDIDPKRLAQAKNLVQIIIDKRGLKAKVEATTNQREAVKDADYVITTFQQGGLDVYFLDIEIPRKYGVEQCVGDTIGPGGVFRALRTIPVLIDICHDMTAVAKPDALLLNYVNPMAANCWAIDRATGRPHVGLCDSVIETSQMLARWLNIPPDDIVYHCAGINHQAFFLEFHRGDEDLYPLLWQAVGRKEIETQDPVRIDLMKHFGFFVTKSSSHASEYVPYFRKTAKMVTEELVPRFKEGQYQDDENNHALDFARTGGYLRYCINQLDKTLKEYDAIVAGEIPLPSHRTIEYGSHIIEAIETNWPIRVNGNIPNRGLINNLPQGSCVEVPCLVDGYGIQPTAIGALPPQLAALNRTNINVQDLIVEAALTGNLSAVYHAVMFDPLTAAVCTLPQIHALTTEMLEAQAQWLPQFKI